MISLWTRFKTIKKHPPSSNSHGLLWFFRTRRNRAKRAADQTQHYQSFFEDEYKKFKEVKKERGWSVKKSKAHILTELREKTDDRKNRRKIINDIVYVVCDS